LPVVETWFAVY